MNGRDREGFYSGGHRVATGIVVWRNGIKGDRLHSGFMRQKDTLSRTCWMCWRLDCFRLQTIVAATGIALVISLPWRSILLERLVPNKQLVGDSASGSLSLLCTSIAHPNQGTPHFDMRSSVSAILPRASWLRGRKHISMMTTKCAGMDEKYNHTSIRLRHDRASDTMKASQPTIGTIIEMALAWKGLELIPICSGTF